MAQQQGYRDTAQSNCAARIAQNHDALAIPAINQRPGGQDEEREGQASQGTNQPGLRRRMCEREYQQRKGQLRNERSHRGDDLAAPQQHVIAIAPQWNALWRNSMRLSYSLFLDMMNL